jgi:actin-related protein
VFIGQRAQDLRGLLKIRYPLEHGIVTDWDDMERIWEWVYGEGLKTLSEEVSAVVDFGGCGWERRVGVEREGCLDM